MNRESFKICACVGLAVPSPATHTSLHEESQDMGSKMRLVPNFKLMTHHTFLKKGMNLAWFLCDIHFILQFYNLAAPDLPVCDRLLLVHRGPLGRSQVHLRGRGRVPLSGWRRVHSHAMGVRQRRTGTCWTNIALVYVIIFLKSTYTVLLCTPFNV